MSVARALLLPVAALPALLGCAGSEPTADAPAPPANPSVLRLTGHGHRVERIGDTLYSVGGFTRGNRDPGRDTRRTFAFELPAGPWVRRASTNGPQAFAATAVVDGTLHAIGGAVERYDAAADRWTIVPGTDVMPRTHLAAAAVGPRIHVIGGYPAERSAHHVFDTTTGTVSEPPPPPGFGATDHLQIVVSIAGRLHCVGGIDGETFDISDAHHVFDGGLWHPRAKPPVPVWAKFSAYAVVGHELFVFDHERGLRYDADTDTWDDAAPLPAYLAMPATVVLGGRIHVLGGMPVGEGEVGVHVYDPDSDVWSSYP